MAIKGKRKPRGGTGAPRTVAPKPKVEARKPALVRRTWFRRTFVAASALLVLFVTLTVLGRTHRTGALESYDRKLATAQRPFKQSTEAANATGINTVPTKFGEGSAKPKELRDNATIWESNFKKAAENVRALTPPEQLEAANEQIALAMDQYAGLARLYIVAANERDLQNEAKDAALKKKIGDHITLLLSHLLEEKTKADALLTAAQGQIDDLKRAWGVEVTTPLPQSNPSLPISIPS